MIYAAKQHPHLEKQNIFLLNKKETIKSNNITMNNFNIAN